MNITTTINSADNDQQTASAGFRVDISRGDRIGRVSSEWFSRPDDERYLSLTELYDALVETETEGEFSLIWSRRAAE